MDRYQRGCVYLSLVALCLLIGSTFGPLIRDRSIRQQTSEEDLNANIEHLYRKDFKASSSPKEPAGDQNGTDLVVRSNPVSQRKKQPIDGSEQKGMLSVVRDEYGKLKPVFASTTTKPATKPPKLYEPVVSKPASKLDEILVLRGSGANGTSADAPDIREYPEDYPFDRIEQILRSHREIYREVFEQERMEDSLSTRIDSPSDQYLCSSTRSYEYPTYHPKLHTSIVNVKGFYQRITFEQCDYVGNPCSNAITDGGSRLVCEQVYSKYEVYVVPAGNEDHFRREDLEFPSCCKCRHET